MPIFEYEPDCGHCDRCGGRFEVVQRMNDKPLENCPGCGLACHRVISSFQIGGKGKSLLSPKNIEAHGFTQYVKKGKGYYEKTAGKGPKGIAKG